VITIRKADERGHAEGEGVDSYHTFSFADYIDPQWMGFRSLRVINDDLIMPGKGFGMHPHKNMEIITIVLGGILTHRDSMGNVEKIGAGQWQVMTAGTGIQHSEINATKDEAVHLLQIWILPNQQGLQPRYEVKSLSSSDDDEMQLLASGPEQDGSVLIHQDVKLYLARLDWKKNVNYPLPTGRGAWVHTAIGQIILNGIPLDAGDSAAITNENKIEMVGVSPSQVLLFDLK